MSNRTRLYARLAGATVRVALGGLLSRDRERLRERQFDAFISYSHALDGRLAVALQQALHRLARPWYRLRALHVFRDDTNLAANPDLWSSITTGLGAARYFVLLASPEAARSEWVGKEIHHWREHKPEHRMLLVLTAGELHWDPEARDFDWERTDAVPRALSGAFGDEPRYVDLRFARDLEPLSLRDPRFRDAVADLAAAIHERPKDELIGEDVRQHRRTRRIAWTAALALLGLAIAASVAAIVAVRERDRAEEQLRLATSRFVTQEATEALGEQHSQSVLLALEAHELSQTPEARSLLYRALARRPEIVRFMQSDAGAPFEVAVSPDGETLAAPTSSGVVNLWDADSGRLGQPVQVGGVPLLAAAYSESGDTLAAGAENGSVHLFDAESRQEYSELRPRREYGAALSLTFAGDRRLAAGYSDDIVVLWDTHSGKVVDELPAPGGPVDELSFGSRGQQLAVGAGGATVDVWELRGLPSFVTSLDLGTTSEAVSFSPRGDMLAVGNIDGDVRLWDSRGWRPLASPGSLPGAVSDLAFSANGRALAIATNDRVVRLWSTREVEWLREPLLGHIGSVAAVSFAPSGLGLASAGLDGNLIMWDPNRSDRLAQSFPAKTEHGRYTRMAFDPVTGRLAWTASRGGLLLGDLAGGRPTELLSPSRTRSTLGVSRLSRTISSLEFSPDGETLAAAIGKGDPVESSVQFWSAETGRRVQTPVRSPAQSVSFSPDGRTLVVGVEDQLHFVDMVAGDREVERLRGLQGRDAEFSPNGQTLAAPVGLEGEVALVDAATLEEVATVDTGEAAFVSDVAFSPDGQTLAGGDVDGNVVLWDVAGGDRLGPPLTTGTTIEVEDLAFSPDGTLLASSDVFARMHLWDVALRRSLGPSLIGAAPAFSDDGELLVAIWPGRGVVLRGFDFDSWREIGCSLANRNLGEEEWDRFLGSVQDYEPTCPGLSRGQPAEAELLIPGE